MNQNIMNLLTDLIMAIIVVCVPILSKYLAAVIKQWGDNAAADTEDIKVKRYIQQISDAVATAVISTNQTYVDTLKAQGNFAPEAQEIAFKKSLRTAQGILAPEALEFIKTVYGDVEGYLTPLIETQVNKEKKKNEVLELGILAEE